jgi:hypothetical protein
MEELVKSSGGTVPSGGPGHTEADDALKVMTKELADANKKIQELNLELVNAKAGKGGGSGGPSFEKEYKAEQRANNRL